MGNFEYPPNDEQPAEGGASQEEGAEQAIEADESEALRAEVTALNEKVLRLAAELENTRRRAEREKQEAGRYAIASFARDLLTVADTFERALGAAPQEGDEVSPEALASLVSGIRMTDAALLGVLERHGVKKINPKGEKFDPNLHMAVSQAPGDVPAGHVQDVAQPGFVIGDRVLRAAMVIVSTGGAKAAPGSEAPAGDEEDQSSDASRMDRRA